MNSPFLLSVLLQSSGSQLFGINIINTDDFYTLLIRFVISTAMIIGIIRYLYYPTTLRKDYLFTFILLGVLIFFMCNLLANVKLQLGFALGLFAVFGIIRYRTNPIPIKEMSYLFLVITIAVINAVSSKKVSYVELTFSNASILLITLILEKGLFLRHLSQRQIIYEKIDLIKPQKRDELIEDLINRTGLDIKKVEIGKVDFLKDVAWITIHYNGGINEHNENQSQNGNYQDDDD